jgi:hypothetical protein
MSDLTRDLLDDDRPIPLKRAAVRTAAGQVAPSYHAAPETDPASKSHRAALIDQRPAADADAAREPVAGPVPLPVAPAGGIEAELPVPDVVLEPVQPLPEAARPEPAEAPAATSRPDGHPLDGLRRFRMEPILVEPVYDAWSDIRRFLIELGAVMAVVFALIVAFVLLVAHLRGTPA